MFYCYTITDAGFAPVDIPEGYKLVEDEDHKKQRLEKECEALATRKKMLLGLLDEVDLRFKEIKAQLKLPETNKK